jgi:hypothetical protein
MATTIHFETELTREGLEAVRADIERLLSGIGGDGADVEWRLPTLAQQRVDQLWPRLGDHLRSLLTASAREFDDAASFTLEDLADKLAVDLKTLKSWHRNLSRSIKRVDRELGSEPPILPGEWSDTEWRMRYRMLPEVRRAIVARADE